MFTVFGCLFTVIGWLLNFISSSVMKMRKKEVNALEEYAKVNGAETGNKCLLNLVVVGHVDSGKSTLMGHLLFLLGCVSSRVMHKYEQDARKVTCIFIGERLTVFLTRGWGTPLGSF